MSGKIPEHAVDIPPTEVKLFEEAVGAAWEEYLRLRAAGRTALIRPELRLRFGRLVGRSMTTQTEG